MTKEYNEDEIYALAVGCGKGDESCDECGEFYDWCECEE